MKRALLVAILGVSACGASHNDSQLTSSDTQLRSLIGGTFEVRNPKCAEFGEAIGNKVVISVKDVSLATVKHFVTVAGKQMNISMVDGKIQMTSEETGAVATHSGLSYGNGFAYSEEMRNANGTRILSKVEYTLNWEMGQLHLKQTTRVDARHNTVKYCDLKRIAN